MPKHIPLIASVFLLTFASACDPDTLGTGSAASVQQVALQEQPIARLATAPSSDYAYRIGVGDEIEIKFFFTPELNDRMTVRPDGKISVMFAQDVQAAGRTADELSSDIKARLASYVKQPDLVVIVRTFASQKVYVGGEVAKPGPVQLTARENLLQVIGDAGWITPLASHDKVLLVRRGEGGRDLIYPLDFRKMLSGADMSQNITLVAGDLVLVPPSGIVEADRWVDQYIRQMIPVTAGVYVNGGGR